ncbi:NAD(P)-binding protein [Paramyrothecium foliicola]|nr:NAD(P)-binding protein [Paramyrothecium foliicola]
MSSPSVLVLGASGFLGEYVSQELIRQRSRFSRVAILTEVSKRHKFEAVEKQGIEIVLGSFKDADSFKGQSCGVTNNTYTLQHILTQSSTGFDTVYSLLGNHAMKDQPSIIDAAVKGGVTEFYPSEYGSDIAQDDFRTNRYFRDKLLTRAHLEKVAKLNPNFNYTYIMVGGFVEFAVKPYFGVDTEEHTFTFYGTPDKQEALTASADVARYLVESTFLPKSDTGGERAFRVPGGVYSWQQIIDSISAAQGVAYTSTYLPQQDAFKKASECSERGDVDGELVYSLKALMGDAEAITVPKPWDNDKFPFQPESLQNTLARIFAKRKEVDQ